MPQRAIERRPKPDRYRRTAHQRGYTHAWQKAARAFLDLHPTCVRCEAKGLVTTATVVDHRIPHRGDKRLFWDQTNWDPLCKPCHDRKTASGQ